MTLALFTRISVTALVCALSAWTTHAQPTFPTKPIRIIVPAGPGGATDNLARTLADNLTRTLGQPAIVENRPGAGGIIGTQAVASAAPDGHTLLMATPAFVANPSLFNSLPYDSLKSFAPVSLISNLSMVLVVNKDLPVNSMAELIAYAKANPGRLNYGTAGAGSQAHVGAEMLKSMTGVAIVHVPYKSSPEAMTAVLSGDVQMYMITTLSVALPQIKSGRVKALGVSSKSRIELLPDVPSISETVPGYEIGGWSGILAPAGTPPAVVDKLQKVLAQAVHDPKVAQMLANDGAIGVGSTPQEFTATVKRDIDHWGKLLAAAGVKKE